MIDGLALALRALGFILLFQCTGAVLFLAIFAPGLAPATHESIRATAVRVTLAALACVLAEALLAPARLAGEWGGLEDAALWRLTLAAPGAWVFWLRLTGLAVMLQALRAAAATPRLLARPGALVALCSFLVGGHALVDAHRLLLAPLLALHVLVVAFWFGALWPLWQVLRTEPAAAAARVLQDFSQYAVRLVPLLGLAGLSIAWLLLPDLAALAQPYGRLLCLKALLFAVLLALAAHNKLRLVPALARGEQRAARALRRSLLGEYGLIVLVLVVTALMTALYSPGAQA